MPESRIFHESVIHRQIIVCQQLRKVIPDWQSRRMRINDLVEEFQYPLVFDLAPDLRFQNIMVDALIVFPNIHFQDVDRLVCRVFGQEPPHAIRAFVYASFLDPGIRVFDASPDKVSPGHALDCVLYDIIFVAWIPVDFPHLAAVSPVELAVAPNVPRSAYQFFPQFLYVSFKMPLEPYHLMITPLVAPRFFVRREKILRRYDLIEDVSKPFHRFCLSVSAKSSSWAFDKLHHAASPTNSDGGSGFPCGQARFTFFR